MEIIPEQLFSRTFYAYVQQWLCGPVTSVLNQDLETVRLRGQPHKEISLDEERVVLGEKVQVLGWSGDWIKIKMENENVGWIRSKYLGAFPYGADFEEFVSRWWMFAPTPPHCKLHFRISGLEARFNMCSYNEVSSKSKQSIRAKTQRAKEHMDLDIEHGEQYAYLFLKISKHVAFYADADRQNFSFQQSWNYWAWVEAGNSGDSAHAEGVWIEKTLHDVHFTLGYISTDRESMERMVNHINRNILAKDLSNVIDAVTRAESLFQPRLAHVYDHSSSWAAGQRIPAVWANLDELLDLVDRGDIKSSSSWATNSEQWSQWVQRDQDRWETQLAASTKAILEANRLSDRFQDITIVETNRSGISSMPSLLQEKLIAIVDYLVYSSRACPTLQDYLASHFVRDSSLHVSDWTPHYYEWWPVERFHAF